MCKCMTFSIFISLPRISELKYLWYEIVITIFFISQNTTFILIPNLLNECWARYFVNGKVITKVVRVYGGEMIQVFYDKKTIQNVPKMFDTFETFTISLGIDYGSLFTV